jgi:FKBP-type peptidyl-prolyl cis-trans isomerase FkpA
MNRFLGVLFMGCILVAGCNTPTVEEKRTQPDREGEALVRANSYLVKKDAGLIKSYANRRQWDLLQTPGGLYYIVFARSGEKTNANKSKRATIAYKLELLDGTLCYSSDSTGLKTFSFDKKEVEAGLEEGIKMLKPGDSACFILPPHLAYGLLGDQNKIPPRAIIVYHVKLINLER